MIQMQRCNDTVKSLVQEIERAERIWKWESEDPYRLAGVHNIRCSGEPRPRWATDDTYHGGVMSSSRSKFVMAASKNKFWTMAFGGLRIVYNFSWIWLSAVDMWLMVLSPSCCHLPALPRWLLFVLSPWWRFQSVVLRFLWWQRLLKVPANNSGVNHMLTICVSSKVWEHGWSAEFSIWWGYGWSRLLKLERS